MKDFTTFLLENLDQGTNLERSALKVLFRRFNNHWKGFTARELAKELNCTFRSAQKVLQGLRNRDLAIYRVSNKTWELNLAIDQSEVSKAISCERKGMFAKDRKIAQYIAAYDFQGYLVKVERDKFKERYW